MCSTWRAAAVGLIAVAMIAVTAPAARSDEEGRLSGLSSFLLETEFEGWVAASYFWNFNDPPNSLPNSYVSSYFHPQHNSLQFDEAWFVLDNAATKESPAGFHFEITYGATASYWTDDSTTYPSGDGNDLWVTAAYAEYRTPWGPAITAGKFGTPIGYEVAGAPQNVNITRGLVWGLQPVEHTGVKVSQEFDGGLFYSFGAVNGAYNDQPDFNDNKGFLWTLGYGTDMFSASFNGIVAKSPDLSVTGIIDSGDADLMFLLDGVLEAAPSDRLLLWLNLDYLQIDYDSVDFLGTTLGPLDFWFVASAAGGRLGITEKCGLGGRVEWVLADIKDSPSDPLHLYSVTVTGDYALTKNLTWKIEYKYEGARWEGFGVAIFPDDSTLGLSDTMHLIGTQLYYAF